MLENRIKELNFSSKIFFIPTNKTMFPKNKEVGVYIIWYHTNDKLVNNPSIFKIGEGIIRNRFKKYLWAKKYGSTAHHIRTEMIKLKDSNFTVSWISCTKEEAKIIEKELLCMYYFENNKYPIGNKGCK